MQIIQFYLDGRFLCKNLVDSLRMSDPSDFCSSMIRRIKEYYNLEDIIIIDSIKMLHGENNTLLRKEVVSYVRGNMDFILTSLNDHKLTKFTIDDQGGGYEIYISRIMSGDEDGDGLIICVEHSPTLLSRQEKESLENSIHLLKNRLFYG